MPSKLSVNSNGLGVDGLGNAPDTKPTFLSKKEQVVVNKWYNNYILMKDVVQIPYRFFNDITLTDFIDDSVKRFNGYTPPRTGKYDWQAHVFNNVTRNKTLALFAKVGVDRPKIKVSAMPKGNLPDKRLGQVIIDTYEYSEVKDNASKNYIFETLECSTKGTVISYEGYKSQYRKIKEVVEYDPLTGEISYREKEIKEFNGCYSEICNLTDFFIWNAYEPDIQKQARLIWRKRMPLDEFRFEYAKYKNVDRVKPANELTWDELRGFFDEDWTAELEAGIVEVLYCFEKSLDEMVIIANGIPLQDGPFPWAHKQYPFAKTVFEPFDYRFFWGNSLPNKMKSDQDVLNTLYNMALDKTYLSIFPPILDSTINEIEDELMVPARRMPVEDVNSMRELTIKSVDQSHFNMIALSNQNLDDASVPKSAQGQAESNVTARATVLAEENARKLVGLFNMMMEDLVWQKSKLRVANILQFYTVPEKVDEMFDEKGKKIMEERFREIRLEDIELEEGRLGMRVTRFVDDMDENEKKARGKAIAIEEEDFLATQGQPLHIIEVPGSYIRNLDVDVMVVKESGYLKSRSTEMALGLEFIKYVKTLFPGMVNDTVLLEDLAKLYDKDIDRLLSGGAQEPQPEDGNPEQGAAGRGATGQSGTVRNMAGRNPGNINLNQLKEGSAISGDLSGA